MRHTLRWRAGIHRRPSNPPPSLAASLKPCRSLFLCETLTCIIRPNWNQASATVHAQHDVPARSRTDWGKPRDDSGRYVTKSEGEYRAHWEKEGGVAQVIQTVSRKEAAMLSVAPSIEAKIATLDKGFLTKAVDHLRLSPSYGPDGFWRSVKQFEDSLSASERETWAKFCRPLDADEQAALIWAISK